MADPLSDRKPGGSYTTSTDLTLGRGRARIRAKRTHGAGGVAGAGELVPEAVRVRGVGAVTQAAAAALATRDLADSSRYAAA